MPKIDSGEYERNSLSTPSTSINISYSSVPRSPHGSILQPIASQLGSISRQLYKITEGLLFQTRLSHPRLKAWALSLIVVKWRTK